MKRLMVWLYLAMAATAMGTIVYWLTLDATLPTKIIGPTMVTDVNGFHRTTFHPGEIMKVSRSFCRSRFEEGDIQARWEDGVIYTVPATPSRGDIGCKTRVYLVAVPNIPPAKYVYKVTAYYRNNPLVSTKTEFDPVEITILP